MFLVRHFASPAFSVAPPWCKFTCTINPDSNIIQLKEIFKLNPERNITAADLWSQR